MSVLADTIARIRTPQSQAAARARLDALTKPLGSLGRLEDLAAQLAAIGVHRLEKAVYVFAADHGLAREGVSAYPQEVTRQMVLNFLAGGAAVNVLARQHGAALKVVNCGVVGELPEHRDLLGTPLHGGSHNSLYEPAMSVAEFEGALALGLRCAELASGNTLVAVGEMGIGNTSAATLLTAALTGKPLAELVGAGTGLDASGKAHKLAILEQVLERQREALTSPAEVLRCVGGLEIAAMTAFILGVAANGAAILIDGFIATAAVAFALAFAPQVRPYLIAAHRSAEPGHRLLLEYLELEPLLDLRMRLGEGTGAVLAMPIVESALRLYTEMATFASAQVSEASR